MLAKNELPLILFGVFCVLCLLAALGSGVNPPKR